MQDIRVSLLRNQIRCDILFISYPETSISNKLKTNKAITQYHQEHDFIHSYIFFIVHYPDLKMICDLTLLHPVAIELTSL
ncbi:2730_t:CDS:2 [Racocetra persica]|uniref:2730_t:CDS:1 n=1 Tax=Racocetra persica TaxID=160502 RepID=A0ACA9KKQ7_9GLOM|nr:2730_t:CDS:2 [Racocetra persica]